MSKMLILKLIILIIMCINNKFLVELSRLMLNNITTD